MASNIFSTLFLAISLLASVGFAKQIMDTGESGSLLSCMQKLLPCQETLVSHSKTPPSTCCIEVKQAIQDDSQCLCNVFNTPEILKALNITKEDGLNLAKNCKATVDLSICKTADGPSPSSLPGAQSPSASSNSSSAPTESAAAASIFFALLSIVGLIEI